MSRDVVFMIGIDKDERSKSQRYGIGRKAWKLWCEKNNADLVYLDTEIPGIQPQWHKIFVFDLLEQSGIDADRILYVDNDTIPNPRFSKNEIFYFLDHYSFLAVPNYGSMDWVCRSVENYSKYFFEDFVFSPFDYFNTGVMLFNKKCKSLFDDIKKFYIENQANLIKFQEAFGVGKDQPIINFFVHKKRESLKLKLLPYEYNMQDMMRFEVLHPDMWFLNFGYIYHFNCGVKPSPGEWMEAVYSKLYIQ